MEDEGDLNPEYCRRKDKSELTKVNRIFQVFKIIRKFLVDPVASA